MFHNVLSKQVESSPSQMKDDRCLKLVVFNDEVGLGKAQSGIAMVKREFSLSLFCHFHSVLLLFSLSLLPFSLFNSILWFAHRGNIGDLWLESFEASSQSIQSSS